MTMGQQEEQANKTTEFSFRVILGVQSPLKKLWVKCITSVRICPRK